MDIFTAATGVTLSVPLTDANGNALNVSAIQYRVTDDAGVELVPSTALAGFVAGSPTAQITIAAVVNTLTADVVRALRNVELVCTIAGNKMTLRAAYAIESGDPLVVGVNSFQTYAQAEFVALGMPNLDGWNAADTQARIAALMDARSHIVQLSFSQLNSNMNWGQDSLNFVPEGTRDVTHIGNSNMFLFNGNLDLLRPNQFMLLPTRFLDALKRAQVAEADVILGGDTVEQRRREGLVQDNVGESRQVFRASKPLELPVCRRALGYLSYYVSFSKRIGRS